MPFNLTPFAAKLIGGGLAVVLAIAAFLLWLDGREKAAVERDRAQAAQTVAKATERAEVAAVASAAAIQSEVQHGNDEARKAAAVSDDPLADGFGKLRASQASGRAPAR